MFLMFVRFPPNRRADACYAWRTLRNVHLDRLLLLLFGVLIVLRCEGEIVVGVSRAALEFADDRAEKARREKSGPRGRTSSSRPVAAGGERRRAGQRLGGGGAQRATSLSGASAATQDSVVPAVAYADVLEL
jgi:hypothetical protein